MNCTGRLAFIYTMTTVSDSVPFSVDGKTAIITGAGSGMITLSSIRHFRLKLTLCSGIGFSFAQLLLARGCNIVIADLSLRPEAQTFVDEHSAKDEGKP